MASFIPNRTVMLSKDQESQWSNIIGGLFLNFGNIEFMSFRWIQHFTLDTLVNDLATDMQLSKRLQIIRELIERSDLPEPARKQAIALWDEVGRLAELRNTIAHNPIVFGTGPDQKQAMGIPNVKKMKGSGPFTINLINVSKIYDAAHRLVAICNELDKILIENNQRLSDPDYII
jgi:hypothetical protein